MASMAALIKLLLLLLHLSAVSALQFSVGGHRGWTVPSAYDDAAETYNQWATRTRFHVGDSLYFKYEKNDSVLVVDRVGYGECDTAEPLAAFSDGSTTFQFDHYGFFYFISGARGHCEAGQRLVVWVMVHPGSSSGAGGPGPAPARQPRQGSGSSPGSGSGSRSGSDSRPASAKSGATAVSPGLGVMVAVLEVLLFLICCFF